MWKKILYFGVAIIFGILIYIIGYSSNQMNHLESIISNAIKNEEFYKVPMVWDGCFDTKSIVENNSDKLDIAIYPATSQTDVTYGTEENSTRYVHYERAYYLYIFNTKFSILNINTGSSSYNKTSVALTSESGKTYEYYFVVNENINAQDYVKEPITKEQALLNVTRDVTNTNETWNFMRITFTETMLEQVKKEINGEITKFEIKDAEGVSQYSTDIHFDFTQSFFSDTKELFDNYNIYLDSYLAADGDKNKIKEAENKFQEFYQPWNEEFEKNKEQTKYTFRYPDSVLTPGKLIWQTIGMLALYALVIALFYILLFHFSAIRRIFSRENYKDYSKSSEVMVNGKMVKKSKGKPVKALPAKPQEEVQPDTAVDDTLETITAGEIVVDATQDKTTEEAKDEEPEAAEVVEEAPNEVEDVKPAEPVEETPVVEEPAEEEKLVAEEKSSTPKKTTPKKTSTSTAKKTPTKKASSSTAKKTTSTQKSSRTPKEKKDEEN